MEYPILKKTVLQGKMNKDADERLLPNGQYAHAENFRVSRKEGQDLGVGKSVNGTVQLTTLGLTNARTIGVLSDASSYTIYFFVTSDDVDLLLEYNDSTKVLHTLLESSSNEVLNFNKEYLITAINKIINGDPNKNLLAWTDNYNPPRIINIQRAKTYPKDGFSEEDLSVIKRPPVYAPHCELTYTSTSLENNLEEKYVCFAYRYKYLDGEYSALSPFSNVAFSPNTFSLDYQTMENEGMVNLFNAVRFNYNTGSHRVTDIQLVFKETNQLGTNIIETFNKAEFGFNDNENQSFIFSNSKKYTSLPDEELFRTFDNVPRLAKAQEIVGNRLVYSNYLEGYDLTDEFNQDIGMDYTLSLVTEDISGVNIPIRFSTAFENNDTITFDLNGISLLKNTRLTFDLLLESTDTSGSYKADNAFILNKAYSDCIELADDTDFTVFVQSVMTNAFLSGFEYEEPENSELIENSSFIVSDSTTTTISITAPTLTYEIDTTPDDPNDSEFTQEIIYWTFATTSTIFFSLAASNSSLKTERSYEIGMIYKDENARATTTLTCANNTLFIPQKYSVYKNKLRVTVNHKPPQWATYFNFVIKQNKLNYETIYCTVFYEDGLFRWVKLEGANLDKVKQGDTLILKSDLSGIITEPIEVRVLEVGTKEQNFIEANVDEDGNEIIEESGVYMKIKAIGFDMNYTNATFESFSDYQTAGKNNTNEEIRNKWKSVVYDSVEDAAKFTKNSDNYIAAGGLANPENNPTSVLFYGVDVNKPIAKLGAFGYLNSQTNTIEDFPITSGSKITIEFHNYESDGYSERYQKDVVVSDTHDNFQKFWETEIVSLGDQEDNFQYAFGRDSDTNELYIIVQGRESGTSTERSKLSVDITLLLVEGLVIFETKPIEIDTEIFYETSQTFEIINANHQGNIQNQVVATSYPAIVELETFNCFVQGNGAESFKIKDVFNANFLNFDLRPTTTSVEKYQAVRRYADFTYSDPYVASTNVNGLNVFNLSKGNFKDDLDKQYGSVQKLYARDTNLEVYQEDKVLKILYGKDVLFNADGSSNISSTEDVLGQHVAYTGEYGISRNPESHAVHGNYSYFTDAKRGYVLRKGIDGITEISGYGMRTWFKNLFRESIDQKKTGAFDPYLDVYVLASEGVTIFNPNVTLDCSETYDRYDMSGATSFTFDFGFSLGQAGITYQITDASAIIQIEWDGVIFSSGLILGEGQLFFEKTKPVPQLATISVTVPEDCATVKIVGNCIVDNPITIVPIIINDEGDEGKSITNRFKWTFGTYTSNYKNYNTVFSKEELALFDILNGNEGESFFPLNNGNVIMESYAGYDDTGVFEEDDRLGYYLSSSLITASNYQQVIDNATWLNTSRTLYDSGDVLNAGFFKLSKATDQKYLYLIYDYVLKNIPPVAVQDSLNCNQGASVTFDLRNNDSDADNDPFTVDIVTSPMYGTVIINSDGTITYTHDGTNNFEDSFLYRVFDGKAYSNEADVLIAVGVPCTDGLTANGSVGIYEVTISLGTDTGEAGISYNALSIPDRFQLEYDGEIVADSLYVGDALAGDPPSYFGLSGTKNLDVFEFQDGEFVATNESRSVTVIPSDIADGSVSKPTAGEGILLFNKTNTTPTTMKVIVTGFVGSTAWSLSGICPSGIPAASDNTISESI